MSGKFINSLKNARHGVQLAFIEEPNLRIHSAIATVVVVLAYFLQVSKIEWFVLILVIALVICLEMVNSIFERTIDMIQPSINSYVKDMKDMMAASVLTAAIAAVIIGIIIFVPKLLLYWPL